MDSFIIPEKDLNNTNIVKKVMFHTKKNRERIHTIIFAYLLGLCHYSKAQNCIKQEYGFNHKLSNVMKVFSEEETCYIMKNLRGRVSGDLTCKVMKEDYFTLKSINLPWEKVKVVKYPSEERVLEMVMPTIKKLTYTTRQGVIDKSISYEDILHTHISKAATTYRIYIFSFDRPEHNGRFNIKVLLKNINRGLNSGKIDYFRGIRTDKRQANSLACSLDALVENGKSPYKEESRLFCIAEKYFDNHNISITPEKVKLCLSFTNDVVIGLETCSRYSDYLRLYSRVHKKYYTLYKIPKLYEVLLKGIDTQLDIGCFSVWKRMTKR